MRGDNPKKRGYKVRWMTMTWRAILAVVPYLQVLDTNGDGRIDYQEFSKNIGILVQRVHGSARASSGPARAS
jgi:hypothetical protein